MMNEQNSMERLIELYDSAKSCHRCYSDCGIIVPQPDPKNSTGKADILFVLERPGRNGAGKTGFISFDNGDPTADFFKECFELTGLKRQDIFITNSCLCFPDYEGYNDSKPSDKELKNCQYWFNEVIKMVEPKLIVTIGSAAFESVTNCFHYKPKTGFLKNIGRLIKDTDPFIYPLGHTSIRGRSPVNRSAELQKQDWLKLPLIMNEVKS